LPQRPQPDRWAPSNLVAYLAVAFIWSATACQIAFFVPSHYVASYQLSTITVANLGYPFNDSQHARAQIGASNFLVTNGTTAVKVSNKRTSELTTSSHLLEGSRVLLVLTMVLVMCHILMTARMLVECWRNAVFPCEEPAAMAVCGVVQLIFAGLPALLLTLWVARVQDEFDDVEVGPGLRMVQAGWWLQLSAWLLLLASSCCAHGGKSGLWQPGNGTYGEVSGDEEDGIMLNEVSGEYGYEGTEHRRQPYHITTHLQAA